MSTPHLAINATEEPRLRQVMKDIQDTTAAYYAETARGVDLGAHVRNWLTRVQNLNDLLTEQLGDRSTYKAIFDSPPAVGAELINAIKYARNVDQHLMHIVAPSEDHLIGGTHGLRIYGFWEPIPAATHALLRSGTQALQPVYQAHLEGKEVTGTMLAVLRFFAVLAPQIVHRDRRGEWTGFPLMNQPGVLGPLHPEEPVDDLAAANRWLNSRRPSGDLRVIAGQVTKNDTVYLVGFTFADQLSFTPFVETPGQVEQDIAAGFSYLVGDLSANLVQVQDKFPRAQGGVLHSPKDVTAWAIPTARTSWDQDWFSVLDTDFWERAVVHEQVGVFTDSVAYGVRRARRLNAAVPPG